MKSLLAALRYLTIWGRLTPTAPPPELIGRAAVCFPLVGLLLGLVLALLNYSLGLYVESEILSILLIAVLVIATGGIHLEGTKNTFDAMSANLSQAGDGPLYTWGFVAVFFVLLFKIAAADVMDEKLTLSLLITPVIARWALVIFAYGYHDRCEETPRLIAENVKLWHLLAATAATLVLAFYLLGRKGLWIALSVSVFALLARSLLHRRHAVLTHDNFSALIELSEALSLVLLATL
jgi:adenosylcobinamide-GDP ribazoletransferase